MRVEMISNAVKSVLCHLANVLKEPHLSFLLLENAGGGFLPAAVIFITIWNHDQFDFHEHSNGNSRATDLSLPLG